MNRGNPTKHTQELRDLIGSPGSKGANMIAIFLTGTFILLAIMAAIIKSPDILPARARISPYNAPTTLAAQSPGTVLALMDLPAPCESGQWIAVIGDAVNPAAALKISRFLSGSSPETAIPDSILDATAFLGEMAQAMGSFAESSAQYHRLTDGENEYSSMIRLYNERETWDLEEIPSLQRSLTAAREICRIRRRQTKVDSTLVAEGAMLIGDFENTLLAEMSAMEDLSQAETAITAKWRSAYENRHSAEETRRKYAEAVSIQKAKLHRTWSELLAHLSEWENKHVLRARRDGVAEWAGTIEDGYFVAIGEPIINISYGGAKNKATAVLPGEGAGKAAIAQQVRIKLDAYPYSEYGFLEGRVSSISHSSIDGTYTVAIDIPNGNRSSTGIKFVFAETMYGTAEIITDKRSVLAKVFTKIHELFTKRSKATETTTPSSENDDRKEIY